MSNLGGGKKRKNNLGGMKECLVTGHTHLHTEKEDTRPLPIVFFFFLFDEVTTLVLAVFNSEQTTNTMSCVPYAWQYCPKKKKIDLGSCLHIYLVHRLLRHEIHPPRAVWQQILALACSKVAIGGATTTTRNGSRTRPGSYAHRRRQAQSNVQ